uniref:Putative glutamic acid-rich protein n=1 Tax=Toxoplasma gondii COUG TaxID=1074873 RepID=A0A2G8Y386_TOXGO|nr:putative glutamic acid-rich protein [Toxoplasma gondii COUG]
MASISSFLKRKVKDRLSLLDAALEADTLVTRLKASLSRLFEGQELPGPLPSLSPLPDSPRSRAGSASPPESQRVSLETERKGAEAKERTEPPPEKGDEGPSKPLASSGWSQTRCPPPAHAVPSLVSPLPVDALEKFQQLLHQLLLLCRQQKALALQASHKKLATQTASSTSSGSGAGGEAQVAAKGPGPGDEERAAFGGLCTSLVTHPSGLRVLCACLHLGKAYSDKSASSAQLAAVASILQDALEILDLLFAAHAPTPLGRAGPGAPGRPGRAAPRVVRTPQPGTGDMSANEAEKPRGCFSPKDGVDWRCGDEADLDETSSDGDSDADEETAEGEEDVEERNRGTVSEIKGALPTKSKEKAQRASDASPGVYFQLMDSVMRHTENGSLVVSLLLLPEVYIEHDVLLVLQKLYSFADDTRRRGREAARRRRREAEKREEALGEEQTVDAVMPPWLSSDRFRRSRPSHRPLGRPRRDGREKARGGQRQRDGEFLDLEERGSTVCQQLEDALLNRPECIARLTAALQEGGAAEFVREEALEVLRMVTRRREEMKVIATFQVRARQYAKLTSSPRLGSKEESSHAYARAYSHQYINLCQSI